MLRRRSLLQSVLENAEQRKAKASNDVSGSTKPKVILLLASGIESIEYSIVHRVLNSAGLEVKNVGVGHVELSGEPSLRFECTSIEELWSEDNGGPSLNSYDAIVVPGGDYPSLEKQTGPVHFCNCARTLTLIKTFHHKGKVVAFIGNAVVALAAAFAGDPDAPVLSVTGFPVDAMVQAIRQGGWQFVDKPDAYTVSNDQIITCRSSGMAFYLCVILIKLLCGEDEANAASLQFLARGT